jgi:hypothetical protein
MLSFCDLAGSERISKTNNDGEREERWQPTAQYIQDQDSLSPDPDPAFILKNNQDPGFDDQ